MIGLKQTLNLANLFNQSNLDQYLAYLKSTSLSDASLKRKLSSLASFQKFLVKKNIIESLPQAKLNLRSKIYGLKSNFLRSTIDNLRSKSIATYLTIASLLIISSGIGYTLYRQAITRAKTNLAYTTASNPIYANRYLSFQGRLTDSSGNPITSENGIVFELYNNPDVGVGTTLYTSASGNSQTVTFENEENGVFSVTIGKSHGTTIPDSVFTQNSAVYLQITAGGEVMSPRQSIATVAYAINAESLQGLPPSASGLKDTMLVIDGSGNLNLGESNPAIIASSTAPNSVLRIEGQAVLIKATDTYGGNIEINPDANGIIKLTTEGSGSTAVGGFINATNANLSTGNLYNATIGNNNRGYNFISFNNFNSGIGNTQLSTRFSVDASGNTFIGGTLSPATISIGNTILTSSAVELNYLDGTLTTAGSVIYGNGSNLSNTTIGTSGQVLISNGAATPTWVTLPEVISYTANNGIGLSGSTFQLGGELIKNTRLNIGATEVMYFQLASGNIGIGTTNPTQKLDINGSMNLASGQTYNIGSSQINLNNLSDVLTSTPAADQILTFNGYQWVNTNPGGVSAGAGINFYLDDSSADISTYHTLFNYPTGGTEITDSTVVNNNTVLKETYISDALGDSQIDGGDWQFDTYDFVDTTVNVSEILIDVYKRNVGGTETLLFSTSTGEINNTQVALNTVISVQTSFPINATDRLVVKYSAKTTNTSNTTVSYTHNGTDHYTHIHTPLVTRHNNLAGLQGGLANEYYHLNAAEYSGSGTGVFARINSPIFTGGIGVTGNSVFSTGITAAVLSVTGNASVGGTLQSGSINLTNTSIGGSNIAAFLSGTSGLIGYLDTTAWDKNAANDYASWNLQSNSAGTTAILTGNTVNFVNGIGVSLVQSGSSITINNTGIGTTYAAGNGLTLFSDIFKLGGAITENTRLNIGSTEVLYFQFASGNVGIGTTDPGAKLDISTSTSGVQTYLRLTNTGAFSGGEPTIDFYNSAGEITTAQIGSFPGAGYNVSVLRFSVADSSQNLQERMRIDTSGNVGIGTTDPLQNLSVVGNGSFSTSLSIGTSLTVGSNLSVGNSLSVTGQSVFSQNVFINAGGIGVTGNSVFSDNVTVGGTLQSGSINLTNTSIGGSNIAAFLSGTSGLIGYLDTTAWDKNAANDYASWNLQSNSASTTAIFSGNTVNFVNGVGISLVQTGSSITINNAGIGTTYAAGNGLTLSSDVFKLGGALTENTRLNIGATEVLYLQFASGNVGIGTTSPVASLDIKEAANKHIGFREPTLYGGAADTAGIEAFNDGANSWIPMQLQASEFNIMGGNVGIGTTLPGYKLDVAGTVMLGSNTTSKGLFVDASGNVGIGTEGGTSDPVPRTGPNSTLDIYGPDITTSTDVTPASVLRLNRDVTDAVNTMRKHTAVDFMLSRWSDGANYPYTRLDFKLSGNPNDTSNPTIDVMSLRSDGNVGIGTTSPNSKLEIVAAGVGNNLNDVVEIQRLNSGNGNNNYLDIRNIRTTAGSNWTFAGTRIQQKIDATWMGYIQFNGDGNNGGISFGGGTTTTAPGNVGERMRILEGGNVGIGTTNPTSNLYIAGNTNGEVGQTIKNSNSGSSAFSILRLGNDGANQLVMFLNSSTRTGDGGVNTATLRNDAGALQLRSSGNNGLYIAGSTGNVGIGTTNPNKKLHVTDDIWTDGTFQVQDQGSDYWMIQPGNGATEYPIGIRFQGAIDKLDLANAYGPVNLIPGTGGTLNASTSWLTILNGGNVGIGTTNPTSQLEVVGYVKSKTGYLDRNMLDTTSWTIGTGSVGSFVMNGATAENERVWATDPLGRPAIIWKSVNDAASDADGGWGYGGIPIDNNKAYRVSVWIKKQGTTSGSIYLGCDSANTLNLDNTVNGNPYFFASSAGSFVSGRWYLFVGYIHAYNDPSTTSYSAIYDGETGQKIVSGTDYKNRNATNSQVHRTYNYYDTVVGSIQYFSNPRFEEINGMEPTLEALLGTPQGATNAANSYFGGNLTIAGTGTAINITNPAGVTTDISLQNGETIDNDTDGRINFGGSSPYLSLGGTTFLTAGRLFQAANGSAGGPAYSFQADTDSGMYSGGDGILRLATNGADRVNIIPSNYVLNIGGVSTSWAGSTVYPTIYSNTADQWVMYVNPHVSYTQNGVNGFTGSMTGATLRMAGQPAATSYWDVGPGTSSVGADKFSIGRNGANSLSIDNTGKVGIGTASPGAPLAIAQSASYSYPNPGSAAKGAINIRMTTSGYSSGLTFSSDGSDNSQAGLYVSNDNSIGTKMYLATTQSYATGPQARLTIDNVGSVGIGTIGPAQKLDVYGNVQIKTTGGAMATPNFISFGNTYSNGYTNDQLQIYLHQDGSAGQYGFAVGPAGDVQYHSQTQHSFYINNASAFNIDASNISITGTKSLYFSTYGGGWFMQDGSWIRSTNGKNIWLGAGLLGADGGLTVGYGGAAPAAGGASIAGATLIAGALDLTGGSGTGYSTAPIEVRTTLTPRISFHWPGVVASQIGMDSGGTIRTYDNPGTGYEDFAALTVRAGASAILSTGGAAGYYQDASNGAYRSIVSAATTNGYYFQTNTGAATTMYVGLGGTYNGNVGINTMAPTNKLEVRQDIYTDMQYGYPYDTSQIQIRGASNPNRMLQMGYDTSHNYGWIRANEAYVNSTLLVVQPFGNVGIGNWANVYKLEVQGDGVFRGSVYSSTYGWLSDERLKENIQPIANSLETLMQINGKSFDWRKDEFPDKNLPGGLQYGMIAQDVEKVLPDLVSTMKDGYKTINYAQFIPFIIESIKEQQGQIASISGQLVGMNLTPNGQINIDYNVSPEVLASLGYEGAKNEIESATYSLTDTLGATVTRIAQFSEVASAKIKAGLISAQNIIADNAVIKNLRSEKLTSDQLISPLADVGSLNAATATISGTLTVQDIQTTKLTADTITTQDLSSLRSTIDDLRSNTATVSTLYADQIISKEGSFGDIMASKISSLRDELKAIVASNLNQDSENDATPSAILAESENWSIAVATDSATITGNLSLTDSLIIGAQLMVNGDSQFSNAFVSGSFTAGQIAISGNSISTLNTALYIQPSNTGSIHLMGDTLVISDNGDVIINGDLAITGSLFGNLITANEIATQKLTAAQIYSDRINIATDSASVLATIDISTTSPNSTESGSLIIASESQIPQATNSAQLTSNATAGTTTLPAGKTDLIISTNKLTPNSIVYLTPMGSTNNQVLYVKNKVFTPTTETTLSESYFTISIDQPLTQDVGVNWWIIN